MHEIVVRSVTHLFCCFPHGRYNALCVAGVKWRGNRNHFSGADSHGLN